MAFQQYDGSLMGMSFLEFRGAKQFFQKDCFFLWRWVAFGSGFYGVLLAVGHSFPYPQVYSAEKSWVTKRKSCGGPRCPKTAMVTRFPSLQHRHLLSSVLGVKLDIPHFHTAQSATGDQADEQFVFQEFGGLKHAPDFFTA